MKVYAVIDTNAIVSSILSSHSIKGVYFGSGLLLALYGMMGGRIDHASFCKSLSIKRFRKTLNFRKFPIFAAWDRDWNTWIC